MAANTSLRALFNILDKHLFSECFSNPVVLSTAGPSSLSRQPYGRGRFLIASLIVFLSPDVLPSSKTACILVSGCELERGAVFVLNFEKLFSLKKGRLVLVLM